MADTWGTIAAEVEFEENPRTVAPFAAVTAEYQRHVDKAVARGRTKAALYYAGVVVTLNNLSSR